MKKSEIIDRCYGSLEVYDKLDGCYGEVLSTCRTGAFLILDNGEEAFAYKFANLTPGTLTLCTVQRLAKDGKQKLVSIDSIVQFAA